MWLLIVLVGILLLILLGGLVVGLTLKLLGWILLGLIIGALARLFVPGPQAMGWLSTILYGIGGSLIGGVVAAILDFGSVLQFIVAVGAAAVLIAVFGAAAPRRS